MQANSTVYIVSEECDGYYDGATQGNNVSGSTMRVELQRGDELVTCEGIVYWTLYEVEEDDEGYDEMQEELQCLFEEWKQAAAEGEEGVTYETL